MSKLLNILKFYVFWDDKRLQNNFESLNFPPKNFPTMSKKNVMNVFASFENISENTAVKGNSNSILAQINLEM